MAHDRKSAKNTWKRVLADSANAKHRFGFAGEFGSAIKSAPKLSDLWFIEFTPVSGGSKTDTSRISALAKSVSPITIATATMPIDAYGKRIYIPTRVDFPEVGITMYDTVDGKMFDIAESIYSKFFKNQDAKFTGANAEQVLTDSHAYGRKIPDPSKHEYYHQHFEKITIYHFFGSLDAGYKGSIHSDTTNLYGARAHAEQGSKRTGYVQKIELVNPLVTNITFSPSDYSVTDLRTMDFSCQPENIIIGSPDSVLFPDWMTLGMDYMLDELSPQMQRKNLDEIYKPPKFKFGDEEKELGKKSREDGTEEYVDSLGNKRENVFGDGKSKRDQAKSLTDPLRIEDQKDQDTNRKINELMTLYNAQVQNPNEQGNEALAAALKSRIGVIDAARANKFSKESSKTYRDTFNQRDSQYEGTYTNPDIPGFGGIGNSNPPKNQYPQYTTDLGTSMIQELIGSFFGKRKFDTNNITGAIVNTIISGGGNTSNRRISGTTTTDSMTNSNRGAYATTVEANKPIVTQKVPVFKTDSAPGNYGVSPVIKDKFK
tara:strand:- start:2351 stop:3979 length:1629 start_codon:yes stop_codon:yes gene_type:complete